MTLAALVRRRLPAGEVPWSRARSLCARGKVSVDGEPALDPAARVRARRRRSRSTSTRRCPKPEAAATIVFEDSHVVVIDKPTGVSSVPYEKREAGTAMDAIRARVAPRGAARRRRRRCYVVHRIDKETSGLLAFAKTKLAERELQALFRAHDVERTYLCVAHGRVQRPAHRVDAGDRPRRRAARLDAAARAGQARGDARARRRGAAAATLCEVQAGDGQDAPDPHPPGRGRAIRSSARRSTSAIT